MRSQSYVPVAVALLLVASGCTGVLLFGGDGTQSPPDDDVAAKFDSLETVSGTQVFSFRSENETVHMRATVHIGLGESTRQYQYVHAPAEREGDVYVSNESTSVTYDASEKSVSYVPHVGGVLSLDRGEFFARVVAGACEDEPIENPSSGVSPLPVLPATTTESDPIDTYEVTYLGTDTVDGRTVHGFRMTAASDAAVDFDRTMWLDAAYYYPLRMNQTVTLDGETYHTAMHLENVTYNDDLPTDVFTFEKPEGATVETRDFHVETFDSLSALRANSSLAVPDPDVPDGYEFHRAQVIQGNHTQLTLQYESEDGHLTVSKSPATSAEPNAHPGGENVSVAGYEGRYLSTGQYNLVTWSCERTRYSVVGSTLDEEALVEIAQSMACE
ncbi:DUF4367 domain-containing protein [Halobacterium wangiae]|uniref:DUF4367 domain-containing protein n=1 Tax=Halobacterium wangiae TaxID=2902623 RepID=UPI001E392971|nr:DUF4367 domain-containing protein [Halobacterium wangiae]